MGLGAPLSLTIKRSQVVQDFAPASYLNMNPTSVKTETLWRTIFDFFIFTTAVLGPAAVLLIELSTRMCARTFFDPLPTGLHIGLVGFIPLANAGAFYSIQIKTSERYLKWALVCTALSAGISLYYSFLFLPLFPLSVIAVLLMGMGLLSLSPYFSLLASCILHYRITSKLGEALRPGFWKFFLASFLFMIVLEIPTVITTVGSQMVLSPSDEKQKQGLWLLRNFGDEDQLLRYCYQRRQLGTNLLQFVIQAGDSIDVEESRKVYYRVTGEDFSTKEPPVSIRTSPGFSPDQSGDRFGIGPSQDLKLRSSTIDGSIDGSAGHGYMEWTMVFENTSSWNREAEARIRLPEGGVVSRATLWVNGEPREAVVAKQEKAASAYNRVVRQNRDPLLVTLSGMNKVRLQCFPVPENGSMKVRIGVTFPVHLNKTGNQGTAHLPYFIERNFDIPENVQHSIWLESEETLSTKYGNVTAKRLDDGTSKLKGSIGSRKKNGLSRFHFTVQRNPKTRSVWAVDPVTDEIIRMELNRRRKKTENKHPHMFVIHTSQAMKPYKSEIISRIQNIPTDIQSGFLFVGDQVRDKEGTLRTRTGDDLKGIAEKVRKLNFQGGVDGVSGLTKALSVLQSEERATIVWFHGPQPVLLQSPELISQYLRRRKGEIELVDVPLEQGPNRVLDRLSMRKDFMIYTQPSFLSKKSNTVVTSRRGGFWSRTFTKENSQDKQKEGVKTSPHMARIYAFQRVKKMWREGGQKNREDAIQIARNYNLVTPVTGAVVLESEEQYEEADLEHSDLAKVPSVPEPELWMLLIAVAGSLFLLMLYRHQRSSYEPATKK